MKKFSNKIKANYKQIKVKNPGMIVWLFLPVLIFYLITHYIFGKPRNLVLGMSTEQQPQVSSQESGQNLLQKFESFKWNGKGAVSLVFTGAFKNQYDYGYADISARGLSASVAVPVNSVGLPGTMSWLNIHLLQFKGWEIISLSRDQICDKEKLKDKNILASEIEDSKNDLTKLGFIVNLYLPPCGIVTTNILNRVESYYKGLMRFGIKSNDIFSINPYSLTIRQVNNTVKFENVKFWIDSARINHSWLILSFPNIGDSVDPNNVSYDLLDKTLNEISKSDLQVAVPGEILKYGR